PYPMIKQVFMFSNSFLVLSITAILDMGDSNSFSPIFASILLLGVVGYLIFLLATKKSTLFRNVVVLLDIAGLFAVIFALVYVSRYFKSFYNQELSVADNPKITLFILSIWVVISLIIIVRLRVIKSILKSLIDFEEGRRISSATGPQPDFSDSLAPLSQEEYEEIQDKNSFKIDLRRLKDQLQKGDISKDDLRGQMEKMIEILDKRRDEGEMSTLACESEKRTIVKEAEVLGLGVY
ncbi:MAG: hypothetical protein ABEH43_02020, partial [Flavobacteriales bacterium]